MSADGMPGADGFYQRSRQFLPKPEESGSESWGKSPRRHSGGGFQIHHEHTLGRPTRPSARQEYHAP